VLTPVRSTTPDSLSVNQLLFDPDQEPNQKAPKDPILFRSFPSMILKRTGRGRVPRKLSMEAADYSVDDR
jgi:hypothetical protein